MSDKSALKRANQRLNQEILRLHKRVDAHHAKGHDLGRVSCTRGCSACCKQIVVAELSEAEYILERNPAAVTRAAAKLLEQARIAAQLPGDLDGEEGTAAAADAYWQLDMPCAFLEDGLCSIYEDRPIPCRTHFVLSDPALCGMPERTAVVIADFGSRETVPEYLFGVVAKARSGEVVVGPLPMRMGGAMRRKRARKAEVVHG